MNREEPYKPSVVWNNIDWPDAGKEDGSLSRLIDYYRREFPDGIVNDRWGCNIGDYRTSEYAHDRQNEYGVGWEHNRGLGFSFGYNQMEDAELTLTPRALAMLYSDVVSRGGRLLLNAGPDASGKIPELQLRTLRGVAGWLSSIKAYTLDRCALTLAETSALMPTDVTWMRGWRNGGDVVVIAQSPDSVLVGNLDSPVRVVGLPQ